MHSSLFESTVFDYTLGGSSGMKITEFTMMDSGVITMYLCTTNLVGGEKVGWVTLLIGSKFTCGCIPMMGISMSGVSNHVEMSSCLNLQAKCGTL